MSKNQVATREEPKTNIYRVFDQLDEEQIVAEIEGRVTQAWVYEVNGETGISKKGVDQCMLEMTKSGWLFDELDVNVTPDPANDQYCLFSAKVKAYRYTKEGHKLEQGTQIGSKRQWRKMYAKGKVTDDPFWYEKGCAKAIRNAKMRFIPVEIEAAVIALSKKEKGRVKQVGNAEPEEPEPTPQDVLEQRWAKRLRYMMNWFKKEFGDTKDDERIKEYLGNIVGEDILSKKEFVENDDMWNKFALYVEEILEARANEQGKGSDSIS